MMGTAVYLLWFSFILVLNFIYVAKCNLGKVNREAMLVSSFSSYTVGGLMPPAGAPQDLYTVACLQFFTKCCCNSLLFARHFVLWFSHPSIPPP